MIKVTDESEFKRLLEGLSNDIVDAHIHYKLYKDLCEASEEFPFVIPQSNTFWSLTLKSHLNTSLHALTRAYDKTDGALHLFSFLQTIKANPDLFSTAKFRERKKADPFIDSLAEECRTPDLVNLESDISLCSHKEPLVNILVIHRNNVLAHKSAVNTALGRSIYETHPLTFEDFETLLKRAIIILNTYSQLFEASSYSTQIIAHNDFRYIFECINSAIEKSRLTTIEFAKQFRDDE